MEDDCELLVVEEEMDDDGQAVLEWPTRPSDGK